MWSSFLWPQLCLRLVRILALPLLLPVCCPLTASFVDLDFLQGNTFCPWDLLWPHGPSVLSSSPSSPLGCLTTVKCFTCILALAEGQYNVVKTDAWVWVHLSGDSWVTGGSLAFPCVYEWGDTVCCEWQTLCCDCMWVTNTVYSLRQAYK